MASLQVEIWTWDIIHTVCHNEKTCCILSNMGSTIHWVIMGINKKCINMYLCILKLIPACCLCKSECYDAMEMNIQILLSPTRTLWSLNHSVIHMLNYYLELQWPCLEMNFLLCNPTIVTQLFIISMDKIPIKF